MSWTVVCDLKMAAYEAGRVLDSTEFKNHAQALGGVRTYNGYVHFSGSDAQLVVPIHNDSLTRFTAVRIEARIRPSGIPHRLNIVEGWLAFAFFVEANGTLRAGTYDGQQWHSVLSTASVPVGAWSRVSFEYDGISIGALTLNGASVGSSVELPATLHQPQQVIAIGHWPRGDSRYTFVGDIGPVRISRRDYEDFWRDTASIAFCERRLTVQQVDALKEFEFLFGSLDEETQRHLRACANEQNKALFRLFHNLRGANPRQIARDRQTWQQLRAAWCCVLQPEQVKGLILRYMREHAGTPGSHQREAFERALADFELIRHRCSRQGQPFDRMRELMRVVFPDLAAIETWLAQLKNAI